MLLFIGIKEGLLPSNERTRMCDGKVLTKAFGQKRKKIRGVCKKVKREKLITGKLIRIYENIYGDNFLAFFAVLFNVHSYCGYRESIVGIVITLAGWEFRGSNSGYGKEKLLSKRPCQF
jgi:hypothetical protein